MVLGRRNSRGVPVFLKASGGPVSAEEQVLLVFHCTSFGQEIGARIVLAPHIS